MFIPIPTVNCFDGAKRSAREDLRKFWRRLATAVFRTLTEWTRLSQFGFCTRGHKFGVSFAALFELLTYVNVLYVVRKRSNEGTNKRIFREMENFSFAVLLHFYVPSFHPSTLCVYVCMYECTPNRVSSSARLAKISLIFSLMLPTSSPVVVVMMIHQVPLSPSSVFWPPPPLIEWNGCEEG